MSKVTADRSDPRIKPVETGQQEAYLVLSNEDIAKGFVRKVRNAYVHTPCGGLTIMGPKLSETYARDPNFYTGTFCARCNKHFPVAEFCWDGTTENVGS